MKVALCLSGQPRYLEVGYNFLEKYFLSKYDVDVFFHSWFNSNLVNTTFDYTMHYGSRNEQWRDNLDSMLLNLYSPKSHQFESPKQFWFDSNANFELCKTNNCSMFYSLQKANELKLEYERINKFKYDLCIRARTDLIINNFNLNLNHIDSNFVHMSWTGVTTPDNIKIVNDQFAVGGSGVMDAYSSVYNFYNFYWSKDRLPSMVGERLLTHHLLNCSIPLKIYDGDIISNDIFKG